MNATAETPEEKPKRKRGRPRKNPLPEDAAAAPATPTAAKAEKTEAQPASEAEPEKPKRKRGRPRKSEVAAAQESLFDEKAPEAADKKKPAEAAADVHSDMAQSPKEPQAKAADEAAPEEKPVEVAAKKASEETREQVVEPVSPETETHAVSGKEMEGAITQLLGQGLDAAHSLPTDTEDTQLDQEASAQDTAALQNADEAVAATYRRRGRRTTTIETSAQKEAAEEKAEEVSQEKPASETVSAPRPEAQAEQKNYSPRQKGKGQAGQKQQNQQNVKHREHHKTERSNEPTLTLADIEALTPVELKRRAEELEINIMEMSLDEIINEVYSRSLEADGFVLVDGILDITKKNEYGFLRQVDKYLPVDGDVYVHKSVMNKFGLRQGDRVQGVARKTNEKSTSLQRVDRLNDDPIDDVRYRPKFADLTPVYPTECLVMEHGQNTITSRVIDLVAPIGKGQRGLIVSPPKAGKTTILKDIAASITANNPDVYLICLLVDERPEEVTDMQRSIKGEVVSSTFDMPTENHISVAELVIERAKRLVEQGKDVVILLDSITRLARAYNLAQPASGRILSGGVDSTALYPPKRFLGAARNIEGGGSLTILASALIDTGSKMDEVIFEEFKGTGNMELRLDRNLADRRIFPAIDPVASGTRKEELLLDQQMAPLIWMVRRTLANMNNTERAMDMLIKSLKRTKNNQEFIDRTKKKAQTSHLKVDENFEF
ncbi:MAG: transcription termination factor Rho [Eggerthellaceae bacterium]|nr:transcription termination factor Rho [Eggerthellaceae bacterium]